MVALMPAMIGYWYGYHRDGQAPALPQGVLSTAEFFSNASMAMRPRLASENHGCVPHPLCRA